MKAYFYNASRTNKVMLVVGLLGLLVTLAVVGIASAGDTCQFPCDQPLPQPPSLPAEDPSCDYGRNPEALWPDNPDGHPFERAFCDGLTEVKYKHPLDSLENEGLYCDEVPGCWAYGMTLPGHH